MPNAAVAPAFQDAVPCMFSIVTKEDDRTPPRTDGSPRAELTVFAIIVGVLWPVVTIGAVGAYGFAVWMYQLIAGPPGPPG